MKPPRLCLVFAALACATGAHAQLACSASMGGISFGSVNRIGAGATDVLGTIRIDCSGATTTQVLACVEIGAPDGNYSPRRLNGPGASLAWDLYSDAGHTQSWGTTGSGGGPVGVIVATPGGSGGANLNYYARLQNQNAAPVGAYSAYFTAADATLRAVEMNGSAPTCSATLPRVATFSFTVDARVEADCRVTAERLDFGPVGVALGSTPARSTASIAVTCTSAAPYIIALDAGQGSGATGTERVMTRQGGSETLRYRLFSDDANTRPWGNGSNGGNTVAGSGAGILTAVQHRVHGLLPAQPVPSPGVYEDRVTVTVTY